MANQTCSKKPLKPYAPPFYPSRFNHHHASIAQVVRARIQGKNSLVKHFEDMRLCRPSKEYLQVWFDPPRDGSMSCLTTKGMRTIGAVCA
ncbi:hypothetical protein Tco_1523209, partial [Tanacetum coccineum]